MIEGAVGIKRLYLRDISENHLRMLNRAVEYSPDSTVEAWLEDVHKGLIALFEITPDGLIGLRKLEGGKVLHVVLITGKGLIARAREIMDFVIEEANGATIEAMVSRRGLVRLYERLGFRPLACWMRYDNGR